MQDKESEQKVPETQRFGSSLESLKASLKKSWNDRNIHMQYQNSVMIYISSMDVQQAKQQLINQQSKLISNKSVALKIELMINQRERILTNLLQKLQGEVNLEDACQLIDQLRKINLKVCEAIFSLKESLQKRNLNAQSVIKGYSSFFKKLNTDNVPIVHSYLKDFINFTTNYDPLFMHPYQTIQAEGNIQDLPESVGKLFKMNISYVYRLIKIKNQLIRCLSLVNLINNDQTQTNLRIQNEEQKSQQNTSQIKEQAPKKILMVRARKYETISQQHFEDTPPINRKFVRRYISKSQPKNSNIKMVDAARSQQQQSQQIPKLRKFKIREIGDKSKTSNVRFRTQNYDITEDEDINVFRRKMRVRRERRKRINITERKDSSQSEEQISNNKKNSLEIKRLSNYSETYKLKSKTEVFDRLEEESESSSDGQLLEPRGLDERTANFGLAQRFGKIRSLESSKIRQGIRNRKQRIKLQPISQYVTKPSQRQNMQNNEQANDLIDFPHQRRLQKYFSLSPEITQMNKQSSSGRSDNKQQQAYTGERQEQLFQNINRKSQQKLNQSKNAFRLKKIIPNDATESNIQRASWAESEDIIPIEETNENKFKDGHIRRLKGLDLKNQKRQSQIRQKEDNTFPRVSQKQSPSRLANHIKDVSSKGSKEPLIKKQKLQDFSFRQKYNNQESSIGSIRQNTQQEKKQKILQQIEQQLEQNPNKKKQIKMKPGEIKLADLYSFIEKQKINEFQRKQFEVGLWKENIDLKHSYLTKFYMDSQLAAFGISSPRCDGDFSILYWATTCAETFTSFLFRKYLDYLQKFTSLNHIYIGNPGYCDADFVQKGSNFIRGRKKFDKRQLPYIPFLSFECSNICFEQKTVDTELSIFFSEQIQQFNDQNTKASKFIVVCSPQLQNLKYPQQSMFYKNINSISQVNKILEQSKIDTYATSQKIQIEQCKLFTLKDSCTIKSNYFYVRNGYFVPQGREVYAKDKQKIVKLDMNKQDYSLYFGKKFSNIQMFVSSCHMNNTGPTQFFAFKMFSKQLYGRIKTGQYASLGCYGNWDINFLWQDQLKGTVIKEMPSSEFTFGPDNFFVAIYKSEMLLFAFEVKPSDFFF